MTLTLIAAIVLLVAAGYAADRALVGQENTFRLGSILGHFCLVVSVAQYFFVPIGTEGAKMLMLAFVVGGISLAVSLAALAFRPRS